ncbi:MAG: DUF1007 family protein [Chitinispirillaceae bacterium]
MTTTQKLLLILVIFCAALMNTAHAHPHMFIDVMSKFMVNDSALTGFYVYWDFDEMNSAMLIEEFDKNGNGRFEKEESDLIEKNAFSYSANHNFFITFTWDKKALKLNKVDDFLATVANNSKVRYSFFVPCDIPLDDISGKDVTIFFQDPSMFVAFELNRKLIQASSTKEWTSTISFDKMDYLESIILTITKENS